MSSSCPSASTPFLGVHADADCDMSVVAYHMGLFVGRAGHVLTPELRSELRKSLEDAQ
ncbi:conserved hypothetical protein [Streptomyces clavuligerus]|nr:conserved hypothetical protein [Streptomyces clavuligerus]